MRARILAWRNGWAFVCIAAVASCSSDKTAPELSRSAPEAIGNGTSDSYNPSVVFVSARDSANGDGSGTFVASRCVLTAGHLLVDRASAVVTVGVVISPNRAGQDVVGDVRAPWIGMSRATILPNFTPRGERTNQDMGFVWVDPRAAVPAARHPILDTTTLWDQPIRYVARFNYGAPDRNAGDPLFIRG